MSILKRLFSTLTESVNTVSEPTEQHTVTVEKNTVTPDSNTGMISKFANEGEIKNGTNIMVSDGQFLVAIKDGNIVDLLPTGVYVVNEENASKFASSSLYYISTKESDKIKWGTTKPISFSDIKYGELSLNVCGTYSYRISDVVKFVTDYMNTGGSLSVDDYTKNLLINAVENAIHNNNGTSYIRLSQAVTNFIQDELAVTGISFNVNIDMIYLTEDSQAKMKKAMQDSIQNNQ